MPNECLKMFRLSGYVLAVMGQLGKGPDILEMDFQTLAQA